MNQQLVNLFQCSFPSFYSPHNQSGTIQADSSLVQGSRSPFDGDWSYWAKRMGKHPELPNQIAQLLKIQGGKCSYCGLYFESSNLLEVHHWDGGRQNHKRNNLALPDISRAHSPPHQFSRCKLSVDERGSFGSRRTYANS